MYHMAYYDDGCIWAQEYNTFFPLPHQHPVSFFTSYNPYGYGYVNTNSDGYNVSAYHEPKSIHHGDCGYEYDYNYSYDKHYGYGDCHNWWYPSANASHNYMAPNCMESKSIVYEPVDCATSYVSHHTQYSISYSKVEDSGFNEPEFEEYDPTPYGGGYDIVSVYGNPLPPSDLTCYPRSKPKPIGPMPTPNSVGPRPSKPQPETNPNPVSKPEHLSEPKPMPIATTTPMVEPEPKPEPEPEPESEPGHEHALVPVPDPLELKEFGEREKEEYNYPGYGYDYLWPEYENAHVAGVGYDYGYGKQVVQIPPYECSPEVVDLCESIFGNMPCLARIRRQQQTGVIDDNLQMSGQETRRLNPMEECARYFFGRPIASYNA